MGDIGATFDDRDLAIKYFGTWGYGGGPFEYLNTTTYTTSAGSSALFNFTGTSISVYGTITHTGLGAQPISNYTIDSRVPYQFAASQLQGQDQHQQLFFRATGLALGPPHTLVITNVVDNDYLYLDYFQVLVESGGTNQGPTSSSPSSSSTSTATQSATITALQTSSESTTTRSTPTSSSTVTATQSATITALQTSSESTTTRVGLPILGTTIGGAIAGLLFAWFFFVRRRRNRKRNSPLPDSLSSPQEDMPHAPSDITPFVVGDSSGSFAGLAKKNFPLPDSLSSSPQLDMSHAPAGRPSDITPFVIGDSSGSFAGLATSGLSASEKGVVRPLSIHVPGGSSVGGREEGHDPCDLDLPPGYVQ